MKNVSSVHLRKQDKRTLCHKIIMDEFYITDRIEVASCRVCLNVAVKKLKLVANQNAEKFHIGLC